MPLKPLAPDPVPSDGDLAPHRPVGPDVTPEIAHGLARLIWQHERTRLDPDASLVHFVPSSLDYAEYLSSENWKAIRSRVFDSVDHKCAGCSAKATQVHHRDYRPRVLDGQDLDPLVALCRRCHYLIHKKVGTSERTWQEEEEVLARLVEARDAILAKKR